jgi:hypothetical protein
VYIVVHDPAAFLYWTGHLASAKDWGEGWGASSQDTRTSMGWRKRRCGLDLYIAPDAIEPRLKSRLDLGQYSLNEERAPSRGRLPPPRSVSRQSYSLPHTHALHGNDDPASR